jgi:hypothetical protein
MNEEITNVVGFSQFMAMPPTKLNDKVLKRHRVFEVPSEVFQKFSTGRKKFERWSRFLNIQDEKQYRLYDFAKKNKGSTIILRDSSTGALRAIRRRSADDR